MSFKRPRSLGAVDVHSTRSSASKKDLWNAAYVLCQQECRVVKFQYTLSLITELIYKGELKDVPSIRRRIQSLPTTEAALPVSPVERQSSDTEDVAQSLERLFATPQPEFSPFPLSSELPKPQHVFVTPPATSNPSMREITTLPLLSSNPPRYYIPPIEKDGNCVCSSMGVALSVDPVLLRSQAVEWMRKKSTSTDLPLFGDESKKNESQPEYLDRMGMVTSWMDGPALVAFGLLYQVRVFTCIKGQKKPFQCIELTSGSTADEAVVVCYSGTHYEPLGQLNDTKTDYIFCFPSDRVKDIVENEAADVITNWFELSALGETYGITDVEVVRSLITKRTKLKIDTMIFHETREITEEVAIEKIAMLELLMEGDDAEAVRAHLRKASSGHGGISAAKRSEDNAVWVVEDASVLSLQPDGVDRFVSTSKTAAENFRREHTWRRMLLMAMIYQVKPQWMMMTKRN